MFAYTKIMQTMGGFSPSQLFAAGEQGFWYDPSDFSTMFQDAAGTTPVTAVGQPVGRILDKSGRGNHATQSTSVARPVLGQEAGGQYYLAFDGTDDCLFTGNIDFSATNKMSVFSGVRKLSDATPGVIAEMSADWFSNNGTFALTAPNTAAANYGWNSRGTISVIGITANSYAAPDTSVLAGLAEISTDTLVLRRNTNQVLNLTSDQGSGNYGNYPIFIGRRNNSLFPFNGRIYSLIIRGALTSGTQFTNTEAWVNSKTGAY